MKMYPCKWCGGYTIHYFCSLKCRIRYDITYNKHLISIYSRPKGWEDDPIWNPYLKN